MVASCDALVVYAGRGLSTAAGLLATPGPGGGWQAYLPVFTAAQSMCSSSNAVLAALRQLAGCRRTFVVTSNVDGLLERCGELRERLLEVHGSTLRLQCSAAATHHAESSAPPPLVPTPDSFDLQYNSSPLACSCCGAELRFNISTASDYPRDLVTSKRETQVESLRQFCAVHAARVCHLLVGVGAGNADSLFPEVRVVQQLFGETEHTVVSVGPETGAPGSLWLRAGAEEAIAQLSQALLLKV